MGFRITKMWQILKRFLKIKLKLNFLCKNSKTLSSLHTFFITRQPISTSSSIILLFCGIYNLMRKKCILFIFFLVQFFSYYKIFTTSEQVLEQSLFHIIRQLGCFYLKLFSKQKYVRILILDRNCTFAPPVVTSH